MAKNLTEEEMLIERMAVVDVIVSDMRKAIRKAKTADERSKIIELFRMQIT